MRDHVKINLEKFGKQNDEFASEFNAHLEIIRRYDEVLSEKASKVSLYTTETRLNEYYKPVISDLDDRIQGNL